MASKTGTKNRSYSQRATRLMNRAREEATPSRLIAAGAVAAGAAAYALLRDPDRRDMLRQSARDYLDRGTAWWNNNSVEKKATVPNIPVAY